MIKSLINKEMIYQNVVVDNFSELDRFKKNGNLQEHVIGDNGYLLLSSFSQKNYLSEVSLIDISVNVSIHKWQPDIENLVDRKVINIATNWFIHYCLIMVILHIVIQMMI